MSDSDEEPIPNSANTFLRNTTEYSFRHVNNTCMTGYNFRNNMSTLMYNMPPNIRSHNFRELSLDQRSLNIGREMSPMSMRSVPDFRPHNGQYSNNYQSGMSYRKSPTSVRSMDTTASSTVSAADIALAFKMAKFNKYDCRVIKDAYIKYMKSRVRKRIEKRRNLKSFLKRNRRKSGYDSGEQGSDSSISSDDCRSSRSFRSTIPKESILRPINRSTRSEIIRFQNTIRECDMYRDCTENLKQNSLNTIINDNVSKSSTNHEMLQNTNTTTNTLRTQKERFTKGFQLPSQRFNKLNKVSSLTTANETSFRDRTYGHTNKQNEIHKESNIHRNPNISDSENEEIFSRHTLVDNVNSLQQKRNTERTVESDDYNYSVKSDKLNSKSDNLRGNDFHFKKPQVPLRKQANAGLITEKMIPSSQPYSVHGMSNNIQKIPHQNLEMSNDETDSEKDEIIANITLRENSIQNNSSIQQKRALVSEEVFCSVSKRSKIASDKNKKVVSENTKITPEKFDKCKKLQDKAINSIHQSSKPKRLVPKPKEQLNRFIEQEIALNNNNEIVDDNEEESNKANYDIRSTSDVSLRPSFIKRKLFTQKLDVTENKNLSSDSPSKSSPCKKNTINTKEKNKVRKFASSQSCLSRDVLGDNNVLDLIHKIVPPEQMNITNATNKRDSRNSNPDDEDKWDVTSVISTCNNDNFSDTYTDEEIFEMNHKNDKIKKDATNELPKQQYNKTQLQCKIIVDKLHPTILNKVQNKSIFIEPKIPNKISVASCIRSFWDTDCDSDDAEVRNLSKEKLFKGGERKRNHEKTTTVKDQLLIANGTKSNLFSTTRKESCQILNGKSSINCHITKQTNNKVLNQNSKLNDKKDSTKEAQKKQENLKTNKNLKSSTNLRSRKPEENNTTQKQTSSLNVDNSILTRRTRLRNKENLNESQSSAGDYSILTRSLSLKMKENINSSQSSSGELGIMTRRMMKNKILNDSQSSTGDHSMLTRSQQQKKKDELNESVCNTNECHVLTKSVRTRNNGNVQKQPAANKTSLTKDGVQSIINDRYNKTQVVRKTSLNRTRSKPIRSR